MAKRLFVFNVGDDNVVLTHIVKGKVVNAWLGGSDPTMASEDFAEALDSDRKAEVALLFDTLDQTHKMENLPKVSILDRRKVLNRHILINLPGQSLRGARLLHQEVKTLSYEFLSVPLMGRVPGWLDFVDQLPNESYGRYSLSTESTPMLGLLTPDDLPEVEEGAHWRHLIGVNATGGFRQIIERNGDMMLTRLTQAPPPDTPPDDFAETLVRDFRATVTYIKRLGYNPAEDTMDLVLLTGEANRQALQQEPWEGARSTTILTPHEAGMKLGLGSIGREDQPFCDVLHAAWFAAQRRPLVPLTRSAALGDTKDDLRELAFVAAPYAAALTAVATTATLGWLLYQTMDVSGKNEALKRELDGQKAILAQEQARLDTLAYDADTMRNVFGVVDRIKEGQVDLVPAWNGVFDALESDAVVLSMTVTAGQLALERERRSLRASTSEAYVMEIRTRLADVITTAEEAVEVSNNIRDRLQDVFGDTHEVEMTTEPVAAQSADTLTGDLSVSEVAADTTERSTESFYAEYRIAKVK